MILILCFTRALSLLSCAAEWPKARTTAPRLWNFHFPSLLLITQCFHIACGFTAVGLENYEQMICNFQQMWQRRRAHTHTCQYSNHKCAWPSTEAKEEERETAIDYGFHSFFAFACWLHSVACVLWWAGRKCQITRFACAKWKIKP